MRLMPEASQRFDCLDFVVQLWQHVAARCDSGLPQKIAPWGLVPATNGLRRTISHSWGGAVSETGSTQQNAGSANLEDYDPTEVHERM